MANLQSQITEIRRRIAEPYPVDVSDAQITDDEIVDWIAQSELQLHYDISDTALSIVATGVTSNDSLTTGGANYVDLPTSPLILRPIAVSLRQAALAPTYPCRIVSYEDFVRATDDPNWRTNASHPIAAFSIGRIYTSPSRASAGTVFLRYVIHPQKRYRHFRGSVTSKTSNTVFVDSKLITAGYPDDYFITSGFLTCQLKHTSGESNGFVRNVSDYTGSTGEITVGQTSWPQSNESHTPDVNTGDTYEMGQVGQLPEIFDNTLYSYVTYLCFCKADDDMAQKHLADYQRQIGQINAVYAEGGVKR